MSRNVTLKYLGEYGSRTDSRIRVAMAISAPDFGYPNADAYWKANSSTQFLMDITVPTLLLSSRDDLFLSPKCFPKMEALSHDHFTLELAVFGGHCGFMRDFKNKATYAEVRAVEFFREILCQQRKTPLTSAS